MCGWQVKLCDPLVTHGPYLGTLEVQHDKVLYKSTFTLLYFTMILQQGGTEFHPVVASRNVLRSLSRTEVIVCSWPKPLRNQYFKIVMVDVPIMHCSSCNKVRYAVKILKQPAIYTHKIQ